MKRDDDSSTFSYLPHTKSEREEMLALLRVKTFEELISFIPKDIRVKDFSLPAGLSELELVNHISQMAAKNKPASSQACFLGGGSYQRFVPAALSTIVSRSEFATAYTPYQPEVSQGSLQAIYEFQTAICLLTGMDVANASMYDGPTACAEAAMMACRLTGRTKLAISQCVNPEYQMVANTYARACGITIASEGTQNGVTNSKSILLDDSFAALLVQHPNFFGCLEDLLTLAQVAHQQGALLIVISDPISLGLLEAPGKFGADIVVGDAQPCGNFLSFGGPSAGYMATRQQFVRQLPGRLVGMTQDNRGQRAFTLTLQTREQHIRRAKANSNICTNQALNALAMLVYLSLMGPNGLKEICEVSVKRAHHLAGELSQIPGVKLKFTQPFFQEFVIELPKPASLVLNLMLEQNILAGMNLEQFYPQLSNAILVSVTELNQPNELADYVQSMSEILATSGNTSPLVSSPRHVNA